MECSQCGAAFEGNFCPSCGHPAVPEAGLPEICARCGTAFAGNFCPNCGAAAGSDGSSDGLGQTLLGALWSVGAVLFVVYLVAVVVSIGIVAPQIVGGIQAGACEECRAVFFWLNPFNPNLFEGVAVGGTPFLVWFGIVLAAVGGVMATMALRHGRATLRALRLPLARVHEKVRSDSALLSVAQVFMALLFFDVLYLFVILPFVFNIEPTVPPIFGELPNWYFLYSLVNAAVWEEALTRLLLIGLPMALGSLALRSIQVLQGAGGWGRLRYLTASLKYLLGGQTDGDSPREARVFGGVLVLLSAAFFGILHPLSGWGPWKFVDTFVAGLALGYLFLRWGLPASILLHLSVNALGLVLEVTGGEEVLVSVILLGLLYLALMALGSGFFLHYAREAGRLLLRPFRGPPRRVAMGRPRGPPPDPDRDEDLFFAVSCPRCGAREARYEGGTLTCAGCGTPF